MSVYVFIPGSYHGGWCWSKVARELRRFGHDVFTPTLTGLGERSHLYTSDTRLTTHIEDVSQVVTFEGLHDVILVSHSYAGIVAGGVVDRMSDRFKRVIYLDAFIPQDGLTVIDTLPPEFRLYFTSRATPDGLVPLADDSMARWGIADAADQAWVGSRLTAHPLATLTEKISLSVPVEHAGPPLTFIYARQKATADLLALAAEYARSDPSWDYIEIDAPHGCMITHPQLTARSLLDLSA